MKAETPDFDPQQDDEPFEPSGPAEIADLAREHYRVGYRDAGKRFLDFLADLYQVRRVYRVSPDFFLACLMAAIGRWDLLHPLRNQVEIAEHFQCTKANVNKMTVDIQQRLGLPTQRSVAGRRNMSKTRKDKLK